MLPKCQKAIRITFFHFPIFDKLSIDETPKSKQKNEKEALTFIGDLPEFAPEQHPMSGSVFFNPANESQIIVRGFYYPQVQYFRILLFKIM